MCSGEVSYVPFAEHSTNTTKNGTQWGKLKNCSVLQHFRKIFAQPTPANPSPRKPAIGSSLKVMSGYGPPPGAVPPVSWRSFEPSLSLCHSSSRRRSAEPSNLQGLFNEIQHDTTIKCAKKMEEIADQILNSTSGLHALKLFTSFT